MRNVLPKREIVLLGIGHTNAHVLRMWRMDPIDGARLTCVSDFPLATYSGMLPGVLAGQYATDRLAIDLVRLCAASGARLILDRASGLDLAGRRLLFEDRTPLPFDVLSIGIGSVPETDGLEFDETLLAIKPMQTFLDRLQVRLGAVPAQSRPVRVAIIGAGVGGVEIAFCLPAAIRACLGDVAAQITLIDENAQLAGGTDRTTADRLRARLLARGVILKLGRRATWVSGGIVQLAGGEELPVEFALLATSAAAPPLLATLNLPTDARGFLSTRPTLQVLGEESLFAVGDSATISDAPAAKAGVYAVRQGPVLWQNIRRLLAGRALVPFKPQKGFLKLINTGDGRAVGEYKGQSFEGRWCWRLKDFIDRRFMANYQNYAPMPMESMDRPAEPMRCAGCGGKVAGSVLARVLNRLEIPASEQIVIGLARPDDAAVLRPRGDRAIALTADFFAAPLEDPYLVGRIAALNAASDLVAIGARPLAALALVTLPLGEPDRQEQLLFEILAGAQAELSRMDALLVGGHTIEGPILTVGFNLLGEMGPGAPRAKGDLRGGDELILTKPIGTGTLLAGHMRARCRADWYVTMLDAMLQSNHPVGELLDEFDIAGLTDVSGFGLAGHLLEMLEASGLGAELALSAIPILPGALDLLGEGLESTLAPANRSAERAIEVPASLRPSPRYRALFDPQTSGGLLMGVRPERIGELRDKLADLGLFAATSIGRTLTGPAGKSRIIVR